MKKYLSLILTAVILFSLATTSAYCSPTQAVSVEYSNANKSIVLDGTGAGAADDAVSVFIYDYNAAIQGVADIAAPRVFDTFLLGSGSSVEYELKLPDSLPGGKYVIRIAERGAMTEQTFMHINDALAPSALADINAANDASFESVLTVKGPQCGLDPDIYEANKAAVSRTLLAYRKTGFASVDSFMKLSNQAIAAALITKGDALDTVLGTYAASLKDDALIDCKTDYDALAPAVKAAFKDAVKSADFADSKGFCRVFRELLIYKQFEAATNWSAMREVLEGTSDGVAYNNNPDVLNLDTTDYDQLQNPDEVYREMYKQKASVTSYDSIAPLFASVAGVCLAAEQTPPPTYTPSGGSSSGSMSTSGMPPITPEYIDGGSNPVNLNDISGHWAEANIAALVKKGIISGYSDNTFKPDNFVNRAEFVKMIVSAFELGGEGDISYIDVPANHWALDYIQAGAASGIITGYEDGSFNPEGLITREQAATIIYRALSLKCTIPEGISEFTDISSFSDYALRPILDLAGAGLISGIADGVFAPLDSTTRGQTATLLNNVLEYLNVQ